MTTDPIRQVAQPSWPSMPSLSFKKYVPSTALSRLSVTLSCASLPPAPIGAIPDQDAESSQRRHEDCRSECVCGKVGDFSNDDCRERQSFTVSSGSCVPMRRVLTSDYASPPYRTLQICEAFPLEPESFACIIEALANRQMGAAVTSATPPLTCPAYLFGDDETRS